MRVPLRMAGREGYSTLLNTDVALEQVRSALASSSLWQILVSLDNCCTSLQLPPAL